MTGDDGRSSVTPRVVALVAHQGMAQCPASERCCAPVQRTAQSFTSQSSAAEHPLPGAGLRLATVALVLFAAACSNSSSSGSDVTIADEPAGANCPAGGVRIKG